MSTDFPFWLIGGDPAVSALICVPFLNSPQIITVKSGIYMDFPPWLISEHPAVCIDGLFRS